MVTFGQAIASGFKNYTVWAGRATRAEFWWWYLFYYIVLLPFSIIYNVVIQTQLNALGDVASAPDFASYWNAVMAIAYGPAIWIVIIPSLALFLPTLAMVIRRLHDQNKSGGFWWMILIPFAGPIILFVFMLLPSNPAGSRFDTK